MEKRHPADGGARAAPAAVDRPQTRPTPQGMVYLWVIGVFSLFILWLNANLVFLMGSLVLGCACAAWLLARQNLRHLRAVRHLPRRTRVGLPTPLTWTVHNAGRREAVGVEIDDRPARGARPVRLTVEYPVVPAGGSSAVTTQVVFGRRGVVDLESSDTWLWSRYPLGLFRAAVAPRAEGRVIVRPAEGRVAPMLREKLHGRLEVDARRRRTWRGEDVVYGVREYREGDDPRRIHWRSTARRGSLVVSQWRAEQGREALIVLGRGQSAGPRGSPAFERAVCCAATVWRHCAEVGLRARLLLGGGAELVLREGGRGLEAGLDQLAQVSPQGARKPRKALRALREASTPRSVIYVGCGPEEGLARDLAAAAGRGGSWVHLRADLRSVTRYVRGLS